MRRLLAALLVCTLTAPLVAQDLVDVITHPIAIPKPPPPAVDLAPLWLAIQDLATKQAATEARQAAFVAQVQTSLASTQSLFARVGAIELRTTVLESKPPTQSGATAFFNGLRDVLTNQYFLGAVGIVLGRYLVPAK